MGRMLGVEEYGEMNSLFSIMMLFSLFFTPVSNYFSREAASLYALGKTSRIFSLLKYAYAKFGLSLLGITLALTVFTPVISDYIHVGNSEVLIVFILF